MDFYVTYLSLLFQVSSVRKSLIKSAKSVMKPKCGDSSEFQVVKGNKSKVPSCEFSVKITNRFEVLLQYDADSLQDETTGVRKMRMSKKEDLTTRVEKKDDLLTNVLVGLQSNERKGALGTKQALTETVALNTTEICKNNKVNLLSFISSYQI